MTKQDAVQVLKKRDGTWRNILIGEEDQVKDQEEEEVEEESYSFMKKPQTIV